jgi:hypothetical protein
MIPVGYMAKRVAKPPGWGDPPNIVDVYSVSNCVNDDFADFVNYWKHNGYWFFDRPEIISDLAEDNNIDLGGTKLFFYELYEQVHVIDGWRSCRGRDSVKMRWFARQRLLWKDSML